MRPIHVRSISSIPPYWGVAWVHDDGKTLVCLPLLVSTFARALRRAWVWLKFGPIDRQATATGIAKNAAPPVAREAHFPQGGLGSSGDPSGLDEFGSGLLQGTIPAVPLPVRVADAFEFYTAWARRRGAVPVLAVAQFTTALRARGIIAKRVRYRIGNDTIGPQSVLFFSDQGLPGGTDLGKSISAFASSLEKAKANA